MSPPQSRSWRTFFRRLALIIAALPIVSLTAGVPFANRLEPRIFGLPFLLAYLVFWVLITPLCLWLTERWRRY